MVKELRLREAVHCAAPCCLLSGNQGQCNHVGVRHWVAVEQLLKREFPWLTQEEIKLAVDFGKLVDRQPAYRG